MRYVRAELLGRLKSEDSITDPSHFADPCGIPRRALRASMANDAEDAQECLVSRQGVFGDVFIVDQPETAVTGQ